MRKLRIHHIDSFTQSIFSGNPTVTVMNASLLSEAEMKRIAREVNLSESGFILPSEQGDFRLRFFTPIGSEIKFCGHATVGALHSIHLDKMYGTENAGRHTLKVETNAGLLPMTIDNTDPTHPHYELGTPDVILSHPDFSLKEVQVALNIPDGLLDDKYPLLIDRNQNYVYFKARSLATLKELSIDVNSATEFAAKHKVVIFCALVAEAFENENHVHSRGFAPWVGVPEDPFTGSMQCGIAAYLLSTGLLDEKVEEIGSEQGHFIDRPGEVKIKIIGKNPFKTLLKARAANVFTSQIELE